MNYITLTPDTPSVRQWLDLLKDDSTAELTRVVQGDIEDVDASHYYAAQLLLGAAATNA